MRVPAGRSIKGEAVPTMAVVEAGVAGPAAGETGGLANAMTRSNAVKTEQIRIEGSRNEFKDKDWNSYLRPIPALCGRKVFAGDEEQGRSLQYIY
jgi:hypothetical protein